MHFHFKALPFEAKQRIFEKMNSDTLLYLHEEFDHRKGNDENLHMTSMILTQRWYSESIKLENDGSVRIHNMNVGFTGKKTLVIIIPFGSEDKKKRIQVDFKYLERLIAGRKLLIHYLAIKDMEPSDIPEFVEKLPPSLCIVLQVVFWNDLSELIEIYGIEEVRCRDTTRSDLLRLTAYQNVKESLRLEHQECTYEDLMQFKGRELTLTDSKVCVNAIAMMIKESMDGNRLIDQINVDLDYEEVHALNVTLFSIFDVQDVHVNHSEIEMMEYELTQQDRVAFVSVSFIQANGKMRFGFLKSPDDDDDDDDAADDEEEDDADYYDFDSDSDYDDDRVVWINIA